MNGKPQRYAIVGMKNYKDAQSLIDAAPPDEPITLVREPSNPHDPNAVAVWIRGQKVGFVPRTQNSVLARFIDAMGKPWTEPVPVMALDAPMPKSVTVYQSVDARLHKGNNTYPLVEVA